MDIAYCHEQNDTLKNEYLGSMLGAAGPSPLNGLKKLEYQGHTKGGSNHLPFPFTLANAPLAKPYPKTSIHIVN